MDHMEKYLMTRLHRDFFSPADTDDEQKDLAIQNRIRKLHWVTEDMLGAAIEERSVAVSQLIVQAQTGEPSFLLNWLSSEVLKPLRTVFEVHAFVYQFQPSASLSHIG